MVTSAGRWMMGDCSSHQEISRKESAMLRSKEDRTKIKRKASLAMPVGAAEDFPIGPVAERGSGPDCLCSKSLRSSRWERDRIEAAREMSKRTVAGVRSRGAVSNASKHIRRN